MLLNGVTTLTNGSDSQEGPAAFLFRLRIDAPELANSSIGCLRDLAPTDGLFIPGGHAQLP